MAYLGLGLDMPAWRRVTIVWADGGGISGGIFCVANGASSGDISGLVEDDIILDGKGEFPI